MTTPSIDKYQDLIDTREIDARICDLQDCEVLEPEEKKELLELECFKYECKRNGCGEWNHGETLVRYSYFSQYVQDMLEDCGTVPSDMPWYVSIDWDKTADNIRSDYSVAEFDGVEYLFRSV